MPLGKPDSSYETVKAALTASLERLGLEYVDLYYSHRVLSREQGIEYVTAARRLQDEGLIKHIGLSEVSALDLRAAHAVAPICAISCCFSCARSNTNSLTRSWQVCSTVLVFL